ncbi:hypothetical protein ACN4EG_01730 [Alkalinema pantanalense CENA528]|uniref:hypothetical protein n=1 Tax=Alkalinema pantanalense TaxID=1620705 RepID=UPI003D6E0A89
MKKPTFASQEAWTQAEILMQPVFIRLIDNLRKSLETSNWKGDYCETLVWPDGVSEADKSRFDLLQQELKGTRSVDRILELEDVLAELPTPEIIYELHLSHGDQVEIWDLWDLCYRICFRKVDEVDRETSPMPGSTDGSDQAKTTLVEVDTTLLEEGEVDWITLDEKTKYILQEMFAQLPSVP